VTRIVAGTVGGRTLAVPPSGTRPTSERVREALFSRLLDAYAGSGALGLEAASRGAAHVVLVEGARVAAEICRKNVGALGLRGTVEVVHDKVERFVARPVAARWDLVLLDPPYDLDDAALDVVLTALVPALAPGAVVLVERSTRTPAPVWPAGLVGFDTRTYGETAVHLAEPDHDAATGPDPA
jgi:16S rRNA (guanine966-N2)-methyltransferase